VLPLQGVTNCTNSTVDPVTGHKHPVQSVLPLAMELSETTSTQNAGLKYCQSGKRAKCPQVDANMPRPSQHTSVEGRIQDVRLRLLKSFGEKAIDCWESSLMESQERSLSYC